MNEDAARAWVSAQGHVSRETLNRLDHFAALVKMESENQNLISAQTTSVFWSRHIADSAQLVMLARSIPSTRARRWVDVGSGAGIPGIVLAILTQEPTTLVEPRQRRAEFLASVVRLLALADVTIIASRAERYSAPPFDIITARAVAPLPKLIKIAHHLSHETSLWLLPKGQSARSELASLPKSCQTGWHIEDSVTEPNSGILVGRGIRLESGL